MKKIEAIVSRADDGTYNVYLEKYPVIFGMGDNVISAKENFLETIRLTEEEIGKDSALLYPEFLDGEYEIQYKYDVQGFLEYYSGIITPTALGKLSGINTKQMWNYMHGVSKPRRIQVEKIESALHKLGADLINTSF